MENHEKTAHEVAKICTLAGKIMLQSGAETYRVEDTMNRIAHAFQISEVQSFVTPTGIIFSIEEMDLDMTKLVRVSERGTDLKKVVLVNSISRNIAEGKLTLKEAFTKLNEIEHSQDVYPIWLQIASAAIASGCFLIMFLGKWHDFIPACLAGGIGFAGIIYFHRLSQIKFFAEFTASFLIGLISIACVKIGVGIELNKIIIGSVMPLVPGVLITNAVRDLMSGDLVSGLSKGAEAGLTAFAIGIGIALALALF